MTAKNNYFKKYISNSRFLKGEPDIIYDWQRDFDLISASAMEMFPSLSLPEFQVIHSTSNETETIEVNNHRVIIIDYSLSQYMGFINEAVGTYPSFKDEFHTSIYEYIMNRYIDKGNFIDAIIFGLATKKQKRIDLINQQKRFHEFIRTNFSTNENLDSVFSGLHQLLEMMSEFSPSGKIAESLIDNPLYPAFLLSISDEKDRISRIPDLTNFRKIQDIFIVSHELSHNILDQNEEIEKKYLKIKENLDNSYVETEFYDAFCDLWGLEYFKPMRFYKPVSDDSPFQFNTIVSSSLREEEYSGKMEGMTDLLAVDITLNVLSKIYNLENPNTMRIVYYALITTLLNIKALKIFDFWLYKSQYDGKMKIIETVNEYFYRYMNIINYMRGKYFNYDLPKVYVGTYEGEKLVEAYDALAVSHFQIIGVFTLETFNEWLSKANQIKKKITFPTSINLKKIFLSLIGEAPEHFPILGNHSIDKDLKIKIEDLNDNENELLQVLSEIIDNEFFSDKKKADENKG